jgi:hypothetical protein
MLIDPEARAVAEEARRRAEAARQAEAARLAAEARRRAEEEARAAARRAAEAARRRDALLEANDAGPFAPTAVPIAAPAGGLTPDQAARLSAVEQADYEAELRFMRQQGGGGTPVAPVVPDEPAMPPAYQAAVQAEIDALERQRAAAAAASDMESVRALSALLADADALGRYVEERAGIGLMFDAMTAGEPSGLDRTAFIGAAQAERARLAAQLDEARRGGDIESVRALNALLADPQRASDYVLQRTLSSLAYDAGRANPATAALVSSVTREEYAATVERVRGELSAERQTLTAALAEAADPVERAELAARLAALEEQANVAVTLNLASTGEERRLRAELAGGALDPETAAYYESLLADPLKLEERATLGLMYEAELARVRALGPQAEQEFLAQMGDRATFLRATQDYRAAYAAEYQAQELAVQAEATAAGQDPQAALADTALIDARTQLSLLYRDAEAGKGDPALVAAVQAGDISAQQFVAAGLARLQQAREQEAAVPEFQRVILERNPGLSQAQAEADARLYLGLFHDIQGSQAAFQAKLDAFNAMPAFYRGSSRLQIGGDDIYAQQDALRAGYAELQADWLRFEAMVGEGRGGTPEALALEAAMREKLAGIDELSHRSIDASLGRAATVGPVIDLATDLIAYGACTFIPGGLAVAGTFSTFKGTARGEVDDAGDALLAFAQGAAFAKLGALGRAGTFTQAGASVVRGAARFLPAGLRAARWLPAATGLLIENGASAVVGASFTAAQLARDGRFDAGLVGRAAWEGFAFGLATEGVRLGGTRIGQQFLGTRFGGGLSPEAGRVAVDLVAAGTAGMASDAITQLAQTGAIDPGRTFLAGAATAGGTAAVSRLAYLDLHSRVPSAIDSFDGFVASLRDRDGRLVDARNGYAAYAPGSPEEAAYLQHLRGQFDATRARWGTAIGDGQRVPPPASGLTPEMQAALVAGMAEFERVTGIEIEAIGTRGSEPDGSFWHAVANSAGGPAYASKPGSAVGVPAPADMSATQPQLGSPRWAVVPAETEAAALLARAGGDSEALAALIDDVNRANQAQGIAARFAIHDGQPIKLERVVSDLDIAYVLGPAGRPLSDAEVLELGRYVNEAYRGQGYLVDLVNHGAHFNGMLDPRYNEAFALTWKYRDEPVFNFTAAGYQGTSRLIDTYRLLYQQPAWPVTEVRPLTADAAQYSDYVPRESLLPPEAPAEPLPAEPGAARPPRGTQQLRFEMDFSGLDFDDWERAPLPPDVLDRLRQDLTLPSHAPDPAASPTGRLDTSSPDPAKQRALELQAEAALLLARAGYEVDHSGAETAGADYTVEGRPFECYAPQSASVNQIWDEAKHKVTEGQANRLVIHVDRTTVDVAALREVFSQYPIRGLRELVVITKDRTIVPLWP